MNSGQRLSFSSYIHSGRPTVFFTYLVYPFQMYTSYISHPLKEAIFTYAVHQVNALLLKHRRNCNEMKGQGVWK